MVQQFKPTRLRSTVLSKLSIAALLIASTGAGMIGGCSKPVEFKRNAVNLLPMGCLESAWFVDLELKNDPVVKVDVRDKLVYVYTAGKRVVAFDRKEGTFRMSMQVNTPNRTLLPLVELKTHIVFPSATALQVFDNNGFFDKSIELSAPLRSDAAGEGENIYFGSAGQHGGLVESYNVDRPYAPFNWEYMPRDGGDVTAGICFYGGIVYSASENGEVDAVTPQKSQIWDTEHSAFYAHGPVTADLKADDAGLYVASKDSNLYCVNRGTGRLKWQYFAGTELTEPPVTTTDMLYQYVPGKGLAAIDKVNGPFNRTPRWVHPTATQFLAEDEKYAYLADPRPSEDADHPAYAIIAVDKMTMKTAFESDHKDFAVLGTNRKDTLIYAAFADGKFFAIRPVLKAGHIGELVMVPEQMQNADGRMQNQNKQVRNQ